MPAAALRSSNDICNAREHGMLGDGATNDQPALAALVQRLGDECAKDGRARVIYCPPGDYLLLDATTVWRSGVSLTGAGAGPTRFVLGNPGKPEQPVALARYTEQQDGARKEKPLADCAFASFEIDGSHVSLPKYDLRAKGLDLQYLLRATFRDLYIHETAATGLGCDHLQDSIIEDIMAVRCGRLNDGSQPGGAGIGIGVGGWGAIERLSLNDCIAVGNATNGIFVELQKGKWPPPRGIKITGGHCIDNRFGISDWGAEGLIVSACVMCENHEVGFDVSAQGVAGIGGRGGLLTDCMIDGNGRDGVCIGNTHGPYTVRGNRISENGRYGYCEHGIKDDDEPARGVTIDANEIWRNGLDGIRIDAPMLDASIVHNRVRDNGRRTEGICTARGAGVTYGEATVRDANASWPEDGHKGKTVLAAGMTAIVASNSAQELSLLPHRPGTASAWGKEPPPAGTMYALQAAPALRPGIGVAKSIKRTWIRDNRVWDSQERHTQTQALWIGDDVECEACRLEPNDP